MRFFQTKSKDHCMISTERKAFKERRQTLSPSLSMYPCLRFCQVQRLILISMMFGNGKFHDNFGDLLFIQSFKSMAEAGDVHEMERMQDDMDMYVI